MKSCLFFFLFGTSLLPEFGLQLILNDDQQLLSSSINPCMKSALQHSGNTFLKGGLLICLYKKGKLTDAMAKSYYEEMKKSMREAGCTAGSVVGLGDEMGKVTESVTTVATTVFNKARLFMDAAGLSEEISHTMCKVMGPAFSPECLPTIISENFVQLFLDVYDFCKDGRSHVLHRDIIGILEKLPCILSLENSQDKELLGSAECSSIQQLLQLFKSDIPTV